MGEFFGKRAMVIGGSRGIGAEIAAVFAAAGAAGAAVRFTNAGRIIVIGSVNGDRMPFPGLAAYAMSKSALQGMARGLARDFGPREITVGALHTIDGGFGA